jgi:hypothetical protein
VMAYQTTPADGRLEIASILGCDFRVHRTRGSLPAHGCRSQQGWGQSVQRRAAVLRKRLKTWDVRFDQNCR